MTRRSRQGSASRSRRSPPAVMSRLSCLCREEHGLRDSQESRAAARRAGVAGGWRCAAMVGAAGAGGCVSIVAGGWRTCCYGRGAEGRKTTTRVTNFIFKLGVLWYFS